MRVQTHCMVMGVANNFDGIDLHEAMDFEKTPQGMLLLKRTRDRLDGTQVAPLP